ncbi:hypothetical protein [[Eubacterium] cellulosolvens]
MVSTVANLGSYKNFEIQKCLNKKLKTLIRDEADLHRPLLLSLVIPTKIDVGKKTRELELETLRKMLSECSKLIDLGYLDEILVIDASIDQKGQPNFTTLTKVVQTAYDELDLFRRQVGLLRENRAEAINARRGFFDFIVKTVHQFDRNLFHVLEKYNIHKLANLTEFPPGKGAALWLSIPITNGDIVCFLDSDIMNFKREFAVSLCAPIVQRGEKNRSKYAMTKASYNRLTLTYEFPFGSYTYGGRVTRIFAIPVLRVLTKKFPKVFQGFDSIKYPLSGEFSAKRELLENIYFPNDYSIEFAILNQAIRKYSLKSIAQVDLELFCHIGQSVKGLELMIAQITNRILRTLEKEGIKLSKKEKQEIVSEYRKVALTILPNYWREFKRLQKKVAINERVRYSEKTDLNRFRRFYKNFEINFIGDPNKSQFLLPAWEQLSKKANYFAISSLLKRRGNQSTYSRLRKTGLI